MNPKQKNDILKKEFKKRLRFIDERQARLLKMVSKAEEKLFEKIVEDLISEVVSKEGVVEFNGDPIRFSTALDKIYDAFLKNENLKIVNAIADDFAGLLALNNNYYSLFDISSRRFEAARSAVRKRMMERL
jgi:hypothetical protein